MKNPNFLASLLAVYLVGASAQAQQIDAAFGVSTLSAPAANTDSSGIIFPSLSGGAYPGFSSGDVLLKHHFGVEAEVFWRGSQKSYGGYQPY